MRRFTPGEPAQALRDQHPLLAELEPALRRRVAGCLRLAVERDGAHRRVLPPGLWDAQRLRAVAEVTPDLAHDRRHGVCRQRHARAGRSGRPP